MSQKINKISIGGNEYDIEDKSLWQVVESLVSNNGYKLVKLGTGNTTFELTPNVFYVWDKVDSLTLSLKPVSSGIAGEYLFQFISGRNGTELILPENISWNNSIKPVTINPNKVYQVRILMNCANLGEFDIINDKNYFTIESLEDGNEVYFSRDDAADDLFYSISSGNWISYVDNTPILINSGESVKFKGNLSPRYSYTGIGKFNVTKNYNIKGNIQSLGYGDDFENKSGLCFKELFYQSITLINASELILPSDLFHTDCFRQMFRGCTSLTTAPELPATTLASGCYNYMFEGCTSLTTAPELPATTLARGCYLGMFQGCTSLTTVPSILPATTLAESCYSQMFDGCTSLTTAPELPATTLAEKCYYSMFAECILTTAPELPATTLAKSCYNNMFAACTSLTAAPELPATTLAESCYSEMFEGCTSLTTAPELPITTLAEACYSFMFSGCTSLTTAPELPATTLVRACYSQMFKGCSLLNNITMLATDISATSCLYAWVSGVASTGTFTKDANMTSLPSGANGIPEGWTVKDWWDNQYDVQ